jgi:hypothetical protein
MVARMARWSHGRLLGWASKPRSIRDYVGAESWVVIGKGYTEFLGFRWFTRKPLGSLVDSQSQDRRTEDGGAAAPDWSNRWVWPVWPMGTDLTGEEHRSDQCATTQSKDFKWRTHCW